jgi:hypothetical protein
MPLPPHAVQDIRNALRAFRAAHRGAVVPNAAGKALEVWTLMKLAQAASVARPNWIVSLRGGNGLNLPAGAMFDLPSKGGRIKAAPNARTGYIHLENPRDPGRSLELHGSLEWIGRSSATHEWDVSVLPSVIGHAIRNSPAGGFPRGLPVAAVECKDKTGVGILDETRQTLARMYDLALVTTPVNLGPCRIFETQTNTIWGSRSPTYLSFFQKGTFGVVRAGGFQAGAATLADYYYIKRFPSIYNVPGSMVNLMADFSNTLLQVRRL